ncbi:zona pellucida sperm-binding protein 3 receptor-like [Rhincodon typus]|uniref:zona pellucida sperm-binding protein 3 receptor-like n=1 Tax=Rhincodon typus TaxID=259920 RepID=UPI00202F2ACC|nr:zona pellucida sperm-binding protein 3 receptor-like [Rhincodon typus]
MKKSPRPAWLERRVAVEWEQSKRGLSPRSKSQPEQQQSDRGQAGSRVAAGAGADQYQVSQRDGSWTDAGIWRRLVERDFLKIWLTGDCGKPPTLENGLPVDAQTTQPVGTRLAYKCFQGYVFQEGGSRHITCRENSTWSPLQAVCEPINCGNPGEILNGYYNASDTTLGSRAYFYCNNWFNLVGRNYRICTANGWSGQVPTCEIVQCPDPPHIANGTVSSSDSDSWPYGSIARYSCLGNYSLIGEETITCTVTGQWDKDPPRCQAPSSVPTPTTPSGGCEGHIGQQFELLFILGVSAVFLT